jgi:hypothetical protein
VLGEKKTCRRMPSRRGHPKGGVLGNYVVYLSVKLIMLDPSHRTF